MARCGRPAVAAACALALLFGALTTSVAHAVAPASTALPAAPGHEAEPNDATATASPISSGERVRAPIFPAGDVDVYRFTASAGDRVYATTMTAASASASFDTTLALLDADGSTVIEADNDDGSQSTLASSIAGATIPAAGTYFLRVASVSASAQIRPYELQLKLRSGAPDAETEPNDNAASADPLTGGYVAGEHGTATDQDWYALSLNAGDTVFLSLDLDPDRNGSGFDGRLSFGEFGNADDQLLRANNTGPLDGAPSEAFVFTVKNAGTYHAVVDSFTAPGGATENYTLSATVIPAAPRSCRTYTVAPGTSIPTGPAIVTVPISVTDPAEIEHLAIALDLTHDFMADLDVSLQAPNGSEVMLFTDIGSVTAGSQTHLEMLLDDDAAAPVAGAPSRAMALQLELNGRLRWFDGMAAAGTWNLIIRDDAAGDGGTFTQADLIVCARPREPPVETVFAAGFESGDDGFTHSGTSDEWERGTPATPSAPAIAALSTCGSGTQCWKTDLDSTYDASSSQDLLSPPISLAGRTGMIVASWDQWYSLETASFDHATVTVEQDAVPASARPLFTWLDATMSQSVGNPAVNVGEAAGWGRHRADISDFAGDTIRLRFHLDSDISTQRSGLAIDDVRVEQPAFDLDIALAGTGAGYVDSSPAGIDCGTDSGAHPDCAMTTALVTLTAQPDVESTFSGFSGGGCSGVATSCTVNVAAATTVTATFDNPAPDTTITTGPSGVTNDPTPTFAFTSDEAGTFECHVDSDAFAACSTPFTTATLRDGAHTFYVRAIDIGSKTDPTPAERSFTVDATPPDTTITSGPSGTTTDHAPAFGFESTAAGSTFACVLNAAPTPCSSPFQAPALIDGPHTFAVTATDAAGNADPSPATRSFTVAPPPPPPPPPPGPPPPAPRPTALAQPGCPIVGTQRVGTPGPDLLTGIVYPSDVLFGLAGNDRLRGLAGRDCLYGGPGDDRLLGGRGLDRVFGGTGNDRLHGEDDTPDRLGGNDAREGDGGDHLSGEAGNDLLIDRRGTATLSGGSGADRLDAQDSSAVDRRKPDTILCGAGTDVVRADASDHVAGDCEKVTRRPAPTGS